MSCFFADSEPFTGIGFNPAPGLRACTVYNILYLDKLPATYKPCTATLRQCPFIKFVYSDKFPAAYKPYTAIAPACNKTCTRTAKSTPPSTLRFVGARHTCLATGINYRLKLFQSRWNLKRDGARRPRILFLADRNILADQAYNAFSAFPEDALVRISPKEISKKGGVTCRGVT